jgi:chromosome segregation ATPase
LNDQRRIIDDLLRKVNAFEIQISKSLKIISPTNLHRKSFDFDNENLFEVKSSESYPFLSDNASPIDEKFNGCLKFIADLKKQLKEFKEEKTTLTHRIDELTSNLRVMTLENEVLNRERNFYTEQISRFDEKNSELRREYERKLDTKEQEHKKEINSLKETLNQKTLADDRYAERQRSIIRSSLQYDLQSSEIQQRSCSIVDPTLHKKISMLEVR